jgi:hypothetical protein
MSARTLESGTRKPSRPRESRPMSERSERIISKVRLVSRRPGERSEAGR